MLIKVVFQVLVLYNISQIISESSLTRPIREYLLKYCNIPVYKFLYGLMSCFLCTSVWVGFILSLLLHDMAKDIGYETLTWFWSGLFYSSITWFIHVWEEGKLK